VSGDRRMILVGINYMLILIGSTALEYRLKGLPRKPKDVDVIGSYDEVIRIYGKQPIMYPINKGKKFILRDPENDFIVEAELTWEGSTAHKLFYLISQDPDSDVVGQLIIPSLNVLYMLKMSHRYLRNSPHFLKTMRDIQLMRKKGAVIQLEYKEFYKDRMAETYWYKHPKLSVNKNDFFKDDGIQYKWDHDDIHQAVKHLARPAYEYYKTDNEEVLCDKKKFFDALEYVRIFGGLEETYTLALERHQIPNDFKPPPKLSFDIALMKVCTSITSGWFREWCWENFDIINQYYNPDYVNWFKTALAEGKVKPFTKRY
jgi:hypothetical protein